MLYKMSLVNIHELSQQLLMAMKMGSLPEELISQMKAISFDQLNSDLENDAAKKAFWINCYNAFYLILRKINKKTKPEIYKDEAINIGGKRFSLDNIEHGILRKYRHKLSLGFLPNFCTSKTIKQLAVDELDYRIHFALNCGAASCPPIAFYSPDKIDDQLEMATLSFLESETEIDNDKKEVQVTRLFQWYLGDFSGTNGIRSILKEKLGLDVSEHKIIYKEYSWDDALDNFVS